MGIGFFTTLLSTLGLLICNAQVYVEIGPLQNNRDAFGSVVVYGSDGLRRNLPYDEIRGSAFWKSDFSKAYFYDQRDTFLGIYKARFNFVSNEVHYLDRSGAERAVIPGTLSKIIFFQNIDTTAIATVFRSNPEAISKRAACKPCYVQELNQGDVKLLKITNRVVRTKDSLFNTVKSYFFDDEVEYYLQFYERYERIKKLKRENIFSLLPNTSAYINWINERKLNFKDEADYIIFLDYYNITRQNNLP